MNLPILKSKLTLLKNCLAPISQDMIPILNCYCFDTKQIITFNGAQAAGLSYESNFTAGITGDLFLKLLQSYLSDIIDLELKDMDLSIKIGKSRTKLAVLAKDNFIFDNMEMTIKGYEIELTDDFIVGLEKCLLSIGSNLVFENQIGITIDSTKDRLCFYSTDGNVISEYAVKKPLFDYFKVLLPKVFCEQIIIWYNEFKKGTLILGSTDALIEFGEGFLYTKLKELELLDFKSELTKILPSRINYAAVPTTLQNILERSLLLSSSTKEVDQFVDITISDGFMDIVTTSPAGVTRDSVDLGEVVKKDLKFRMDTKLLKRAIESVKEMTFIEANNSVIFVGKNDSFLHLVNSFAK